MSLKIQYFGKNSLGNFSTEMYKINGVSFNVSSGKTYIMENNAVPNGNDIICVSVSYKNRKIPQDKLEYGLRRFGIDLNREYYVNSSPTWDPIDQKNLDITYYEQETENEK